MTDLATDLKQEFEWAMNLCLESYEVLADGRSFERSDRDEYAIGIFQKLYDTVDELPPCLIATTEEFRAAAPQSFQRTLEEKIRLVGPDLAPGNAAEFLEVLNSEFDARPR